jgi:HEAT repeat protein
MRLFGPSIANLEQRRDWRQLSEIVLSEPDTKVCEAAGAALARLGQKESVEYLLSALSGANPQKRARAAWALGLEGRQGPALCGPTT